MILKEYPISDSFLKKIGLFSLAWGLFEYAYFENDANINKILAMPIPTFADNMADKIRGFRDKLIEFIKRNGDTVNEETVRKYFFTEKARTIGLDNCLSFLNGYTDDFHNCLACIYRIRNNLLHGEKDIWKIEKEQEELFDAVLNILEPFVTWEQINNEFNRRFFEENPE